MDRDALEHVTLGAGRDADGREGIAAVDHRPRGCECAGAGDHADRAARVKRLDNPPAKFALIGVDDDDRQLAQDLVEIGLRVIDAVNQGAPISTMNAPRIARTRCHSPAKAPATPGRSAESANSSAAVLRLKRPATARSRHSASSA